MNNPDPVARAWRLEKRRKELGSNNPGCFYCPETDVACLELDHPVTKEFDLEFTQIVCSNHHKKMERERDLAGLTKNGLRDVEESERVQLRRYLLLVAKDLESIAAVSPEGIAAALHARAASLKRKAAKVVIHLDPS